ncbi:MAG TPA: hypothetical protein VNH11_19155 [Pirellulales bacterium]|nr:hypothetical protein [Pirellulales bacterium]
MARDASRCQWLTRKEALTTFVENVAGHQGSEHIKPLHWYVACRLVIEGGFRPDEVRPRPPFEVKKDGKRWILDYSELAGGSDERTVFGGLKTKSVDVVVTKDGIGPVLAISMKGTLNAFRNLTNRMEEAAGDCTNLHIAYPALVYGFLHVLRANREGEGIAPNDVAFTKDGHVSDGILRYHDVMARLAGRNDIRDAVTKYEAVAICLVEARSNAIGTLVAGFPPAGSELSFATFFDKLYGQYDTRFVYAAPGLKTVTRRLEWAPDSPAVIDARIAEYRPRIS